MGIKPRKLRSEVARAAWERRGAGVHLTGKKVTKDRGRTKRTSVGEQLER